MEGFFSLFGLVLGSNTILSVDDLLAAPPQFQTSSEIQVEGFVQSDTKRTIDRLNRGTQFQFTRLIDYSASSAAAVALAQLSYLSGLPQGGVTLDVTVSGQSDTYFVRDASIQSLVAGVTGDGVILTLQYSIIGGAMFKNVRVTSDGDTRVTADGDTRITV